MPSSSYKSKQVIVMRRDLKMRKGKIAAQSGHACVEATLMAIAREGRAGQLCADDGWAYLEHAEDDRSPLTDWFDAGVAKICVYVDGEEALLDIAAQGREAHGVPRRAHLHLPRLRAPSRRENRPDHGEFASVLTLGELCYRSVNSYLQTRLFLNSYLRARFISAILPSNEQAASRGGDLVTSQLNS